MLPPPAPIEWTSTPDTPRGWCSTCIVRERDGEPSRITHTSKLVPPMSTVMTSDSPCRRAWNIAAAGAAAGPECSA
jgi:hypothetical protein